MRRSGFTLIELSIVLVIIGLIVGAIIGGKSLVHQAELSKIITQLRGYETAFNAFYNQYDALPGDFKDATQYWAGQTGDGNGDSMIWDSGPGNPGNSRYEDVKVFDHMALAGLIPFKPKDYTLGSGPGTLGVTLPTGPIFGMGYRIESAPDNVSAPSSGFYSKLGVYVVAGTMCPATDLYCAFLTPADARNVDQKIDDGQPATGKVMADEVTNGTCVQGKVASAWATPGDKGNNKYNVSNTAIACNLVYWLK